MGSGSKLKRFVKSLAMPGNGYRLAFANHQDSMGRTPFDLRVACIFETYIKHGHDISRVWSPLPRINVYDYTAGLSLRT